MCENEWKAKADFSISKCLQTNTHIRTTLKVVNERNQADINELKIQADKNENNNTTTVQLRSHANVLYCNE